MTNDIYFLLCTIDYLSPRRGSKNSSFLIPHSELLFVRGDQNKNQPNYNRHIRQIEYAGLEASILQVKEVRYRSIKKTIQNVAQSSADKEADACGFHVT